MAMGLTQRSLALAAVAVLAVGGIVALCLQLIGVGGGSSPRAQSSPTAHHSVSSPESPGATSMSAGQPTATNQPSSTPKTTPSAGQRSKGDQAGSQFCATVSTYRVSAKDTLTTPGGVRRVAARWAGMTTVAPDAIKDDIVTVNGYLRALERDLDARQTAAQTKAITAVGAYSATHCAGS